MGRSILAVIAGIIDGGTVKHRAHRAIVGAVSAARRRELSDLATMKTYTESLPVSAFLLILVAHASGTLVGGLGWRPCSPGGRRVKGISKAIRDMQDFQAEPVVAADRPATSWLGR